MNIESATVSVVTANYNYGRYVGAAIESALNLDWPNVEVIVVDDGSTDHSRSVIAGFGSRICAIMLEKVGEVAAYNAGFARSRGDIVIFLDADDLLSPSLMREVAEIWTPRVSKVQVQMQIVDAEGNPTGDYFPHYAVVPSARQIRAWMIATMAYPTPPGSGNVYSRWFLERVFPFPESLKTRDASCLAAAPLLGDVITVPKPLVYYRIHGRNSGAASRVNLRPITGEHGYALLRFAYARRIAAEVGVPIADEAFNRSLSYLCYRLGSLTLAPAVHPIQGDNRLRVLRDFCAAFFAPQGVPLRARLLFVAWAWTVALCPRPLAETLVLWRFACGARPSLLRRFLVAMKVVRGQRPQGRTLPAAGRQA